MDNRLLYFLVAVTFIVSVFAAGVTYYTMSDLRTQISGYATDLGYANLTIESAAIINFTTDTADWGAGQVDAGETFAYLDTLGTVSQGNWSTVSQGLVLENIGNVNVSIELQSSSADPSASSFLGGTNPGYGWNITENEADSCIEVITLGQWYDANTSMDVCSVLEFIDSRDSILIDINLTIPYDSKTGALSDTITAVGTAV